VNTRALINVPVSISYNPSTPLTPAELSTFVPVTLQAGSRSFTQSVSIANLVANGGSMTLPFNVTFQPIDVGLKTLIATVNAGQQFTESNFANNSIQLEVHVGGNYKIVKEVTEINPKTGKIIKSYGEGPVSIAPNKLAGCTSKEDKTIKIKLTCVKDDGSNEAVEDCKVSSELEWPNNGPHDHDDGSDTHLGVLTQPSEDIPITGLILTYKVSEFAGAYAVKLDGMGPDNKPIEVGSVLVETSIANDLTPLNDLLVFKALIPGTSESHPNEGYYGTPLLRSRLSVALADFKSKVEQFNFFVRLERNPTGLPTNDPYINDLALPVVKSEAASLSWGGAYDIGKTWSTTGKHCLHRNGTNLDISMSPFGPADGEVLFDNGTYATIYRTYLAEAFIEAKLEFPEKDERPNDYTDHWHARPTK
ncbi:MAG: hypothetical protein AABY53_09065, partial [Bdellovibrionota bacterium]